MRNPPAKVRRVADPQEIARVFAAIVNEQARHMCRLIYATGMRISEAVEARIGDIEPASCSLLVRLGKGGRQRRTIMPRSQLAQVARRCRGWPQDARIVTADGRPDGGALNHEAVREQLYAARHRVGVGSHVTVHQLRHCFASHLHERGVGLVELQRLLGHSSVLTTMRYIGMRCERRTDIALIGDLVAALPVVEAVQQKIWAVG
jgi:integrase/recombinase XerD